MIPVDNRRALGVAPRSLVNENWLRTVLATRESDIRGYMIALTYTKYALVLEDMISGPDSIMQRLGQPDAPDAPGAYQDWVQPQMQPQVPVRLPRPTNATWFNFGTWGTITVTGNIANQRPPQRFAGGSLPLRRRLSPIAMRERASGGQEVSRALSWGQRLIFISACFAMVQFEADMQDPNLANTPFALNNLTMQRIADFSDIDDGNRYAPTPRHFDFLADAFDLYRMARMTRDMVERARYILGANILLTAIEQDLADLAVRVVIDHIPKRVRSKLEQRVSRLVAAWTDMPRQIVELQIPVHDEGAMTLLDTAWSRLMTDQVLVMALPTETLRLGRDIPPREPGQPFYPPALQRLEYDPRTLTPMSLREPTLLSEAGRVAISPAEVYRINRLRLVADVVLSFDRTRGGGQGSAATDWRQYDDRLNWAVALIRSRQDDVTLYWPPFSCADEERIYSRLLPDRGGDPSDLEVLPPLDGAAYVRGRP